MIRDRKHAGVKLSNGGKKRQKKETERSYEFQ